MTAAPLVLVEPGAHRLGGHRHRTLTALATAHGNTLVVAPYGIAAETRAALTSARARGTGPAGAVPAVLAAAGTAAAAVAAAGRRAFASRHWPTAVRRLPHQVTLVSRCLTEAACVRTGRRLAGAAATVVVLSASEALHGAAGLLGGPHTRFVHEIVTTEDAVLRLAGRLTRRGERRVRVLTPTDAVRDELTTVFPHLPVTVRPFAVADPATDSPTPNAYGPGMPSVSRPPRRPCAWSAAGGCTRTPASSAPPWPRSTSPCTCSSPAARSATRCFTGGAPCPRYGCTPCPAR